jgi:hypothetical protein
VDEPYSCKLFFCEDEEISFHVISDYPAMMHYYRAELFLDSPIFYSDYCNKPEILPEIIE